MRNVELLGLLTSQSENEQFESLSCVRVFPSAKRGSGVFLAQGRGAPLYSNSIVSERIFLLQFEPRDQFEQRHKKLEQIQALGHDPYPREFRWTDSPAGLVEKYAGTSGPELEANKREVRTAGRMVSYRLLGKSGFPHLRGSGKKIQIYVRKGVLVARGYQVVYLLGLCESHRERLALLR